MRHVQATRVRNRRRKQHPTKTAKRQLCCRSWQIAQLPQQRPVSRSAIHLSAGLITRTCWAIFSRTSSPSRAHHGSLAYITRRLNVACSAAVQAAKGRRRASLAMMTTEPSVATATAGRWLHVKGRHKCRGQLKPPRCRHRRGCPTRSLPGLAIPIWSGAASHMSTNSAQGLGTAASHAQIVADIGALAHSA